MENNHKIRLEPLHPLFRILDYLLMPAMWILGGMKRESLQETHPWHIQKLECKIPTKFVLHVKDKDNKAIFPHSSKFGLFHMPIFGGLSKYCVVEVKPQKLYWHIGFNAQGSSHQIQKLRLHHNRLKLLVGENGIQIFALNQNGEFISINLLDVGELGDGRFPHIRLL